MEEHEKPVFYEQGQEITRLGGIVCYLVPYHHDILYLEIFSRILPQSVDIVLLVSSLRFTPFLVAKSEPVPDPDMFVYL
jgi:hypothetical protein